MLPCWPCRTVPSLPSCRDVGCRWLTAEAPPGAAQGRSKLPQPRFCLFPGASLHPMTAQWRGRRPGPLVSTETSLKGHQHSGAPQRCEGQVRVSGRERGRGHPDGSSSVPPWCRQGRRRAGRAGRENGLKRRLEKNNGYLYAPEMHLMERKERR